MTCDQIRPQLSALLDEALPASEAAQARAHLLSCPSCGAQSDALKRVSGLVRALPLRPLPPGFLERLERRRREASWSWSLPTGPRPLAFAAAAVLCGLVLAGPWRSSRLARAPGEPVIGPADLPSLKIAAEPPAPEVEMPAAPPAAAKAAETGQPYGEARRYTNDDLQQALQAEGARLGMTAGVKGPPPAPEPFLGRKLGQPGVRERGEAVSRQLAALRRAFDEAAGKRSIVVGGSVAPVLRGSSAGSAGGAAISDGRPLADGFWSGDFGLGAEGTRTIEDPYVWAGVWRAVSSAPVPAVDFSKERLAAVFLGARPTGGYSVEIADVETADSRVVVRWREHAPPPGQTPPQGATAPYAIKAIPRSTLPVRFEKLR